MRRAFARTGAVPQWKAVSGISTCGKIRIIVMSRSSNTSTAQDQRVMVAPNERGNNLLLMESVLNTTKVPVIQNAMIR